MSLFVSNVHFKGGVRGVGWATPQFWKVKNDGSANAQPAFTNGMAALSAEGGGNFIVPGGYYRFDSGFTIPQGVNLHLAQNAVLQLNHASADFITLDTANSVAPTIISGGILDGLIANSGRVIYDPSGGGGRSWHIEGVSTNTLDARLQGVLFDQRGTSSICLSRCHFRAAGVAPDSRIRQANNNAYLEIAGGSYSAPIAAWTGTMVHSSGGTGVMHDARLDLRGVTVGGGWGFNLTSVQQPWRVLDCEFIAPAFSVSGMVWEAGAQLIARGNVFHSGSFPGGAFGSTNELAAGSHIELLPAYSAVFGSVSTINIPNGYRCVNIRCNSTTGPDLIMPTGWYEGQELLLSYYNGSASTVDVDFATTPVTGQDIGNVLAGQVIAAVFTWEDRDAAGGTSPGSRWVQKGEWSRGSTLV